jgi:dienelactone hydrolase
MRRCVIACLLTAVLTFGTSRLAAQGDERIEPSAPLHEQILSVPGDPTRPVMLQVTLMTPPGPGPFPLAVLNHGADSSVSRGQAPRYHLTFAAWYFLSRGYAVALPMMRGFAGSGGKAEFYGCDLARVGVTNARDIEAVIDFMSRRPEIDASRVVMSGQSFGGWTTLAYGAIGDRRVKGLVNFAGGVRASDCLDQDRSMVAGMAQFGRLTKVPSIWFYGDNDKLFPPTTWRADFSAYTTTGGQADLVAYGAFGDNAHNFLGSGEALRIWTPKVDAFLAQIGLPSREVFPEYMPARPPRVTGYAGIDDVDAVPYLNDAGRAFYRTFLEKPFPRAFVVSSRAATYENGGFDPVTRGLIDCAKQSPQCEIYAYDGDVVWRGPAESHTVGVGGTTIYAKTVRAGATATILQSALVKPDCTPRPLPDLRVTRQPAHGVVRVVRREGFPTYPPANPLAACNHTRVPTNNLDYTPVAGFAGVDFAAFTVVTADAPDEPLEVAITIK